MSSALYDLIATFTPVNIRGLEALLGTPRSLPLEAAPLTSKSCQLLASAYATNLITALRCCAAHINTPTHRENALIVITAVLPWLFDPVCPSNLKSVTMTTAEALCKYLEGTTPSAANISASVLHAVLLTFLSQEKDVIVFWTIQCPGNVWLRIAEVAFDPDCAAAAQRLLCYYTCCRAIPMEGLSHSHFIAPTMWNVHSDRRLIDLLPVFVTEAPPLHFAGRLHMLCLSLRDGWFHSELSEVVPSLLQGMHIACSLSPSKSAQTLYGSCLLSLLHCSAVRSFAMKLQDIALDVTQKYTSKTLHECFGVPLQSSYGPSHSAASIVSMYDLLVFVVCDTVLRSAGRWPGQWFEPVSMVLYNLSKYGKHARALPTRKMMALLDRFVLGYEQGLMKSAEAQKKSRLEEVSSKPMRNLASCVGTMLHAYSPTLEVLLEEVWRRKNGLDSFYRMLMMEEESSTGCLQGGAPYPFDRATRFELAAHLLPLKAAGEVAAGVVLKEGEQGLKSASLVGFLPCQEEHTPQGVHDLHWRWHSDALVSEIRSEVMGFYEMASGHSPQKILRSVTSDCEMMCKMNLSRAVSLEALTL